MRQLPKRDLLHLRILLEAVPAVGAVRSAYADVDGCSFQSGASLLAQICAIAPNMGGRGIAAAVSRLVRVRLHSTHPPNSLQHASTKLQYFRLHKLLLRLGK